jgi:hypothetical protein
MVNAFIENLPDSPMGERYSGKMSQCTPVCGGGELTVVFERCGDEVSRG